MKVITKNVKGDVEKVEYTDEGEDFGTSMRQIAKQPYETLLDKFALEVLKGVVSSWALNALTNKENYPLLVKGSYDIAKAMLAEKRRRENEIP